MHLIVSHKWRWVYKADSVHMNLEVARSSGEFL